MTKEYISLNEASKYCRYSPDYLKLRARQGKLKATKIGRNWFTTREWLDEYTKKQKTRGPTSGNSSLQKMVALPHQNLVRGWRWRPISKPKLIIRCFLPHQKICWGIAILILVSIILGANMNFKPLQTMLEKIIPAKVIEIERSIE